MALSEIKLGADVTVLGIMGDALRLMELGFTRGAQVRALFHSPFGDPVAYLVRGAVLALRKEDADRIIVETV